MPSLEDSNDSLAVTSNADEGTNSDENQMDTTTPEPPEPSRPPVPVINHLESTGQQPSEQPEQQQQEATTSGSVGQQIQENGTNPESVQSTSRQHPIISLEEFRWNMMLLVMNRFPMGLYFHKLEDEYCRLAGVWVKPEMFLEGATEWKDVFQYTYLSKFFIIKRYVQRFIEVTNYYIVPRVSRSDNELLEFWETCSFQRIQSYRTARENLFSLTGTVPKNQDIISGTYEKDPEKISPVYISRLVNLYGDDDIESEEEQEEEEDEENNDNNEMETESVEKNENVSQPSPVPQVQNVQNQINLNIEPETTSTLTIPAISATTTTTTPTNITTTIETENEQQSKKSHQIDQVPVVVPEKVNEVMDIERHIGLETSKEKEVANDSNSVDISRNIELEKPKEKEKEMANDSMDISRNIELEKPKEKEVASNSVDISRNIELEKPKEKEVASNSNSVDISRSIELEKPKEKEVANNSVNIELDKLKEKDLANASTSTSVETNANSSKNVLNPNKDNSTSTTATTATSIPKNVSNLQVRDESSKETNTNTKLNSSVNSRITEVDSDSRKVVNNENLNATTVTSCKRKAEPVSAEILAKFVRLKKPNMEVDEEEGKRMADKIKNIIAMEKEKERQKDELIKASVDNPILMIQQLQQKLQKRQKQREQLQLDIQSNQSNMSSAIFNTTTNTTAAASKSDHNKNDSSNQSSKNANSNVNSQTSSSSSFPRVSIPLATTSSSAQPKPKKILVSRSKAVVHQHQQQVSSIKAVIDSSSSSGMPAQGSNIQVIVSTDTNPIAIPQALQRLQQHEQQRPSATPTTVSNQAKSTHANNSTTTVPTASTTTTPIITPQQQKQYPPSSIRINQVPISTAQGRSILNSSNINKTTTTTTTAATAAPTKIQQQQKQQPVVTIQPRPADPASATPPVSTTKTTNTTIQKPNVPQQQQQQRPTNTQNTPVSSSVQNPAVISSALSSPSPLNTNTITTSKDTQQKQQQQQQQIPITIPVTISQDKSSTNIGTWLISNMAAAISNMDTANLIRPQDKSSPSISSNLTSTTTTTNLNTTNPTALNPQQILSPIKTTTTTTNTSTSKSATGSISPVSSTSISPEKQPPKSPIVKPAIFNPPQQKPSSSSERNPPPKSTTPPPSSSQSQDVSFSQLSPTEARNVSMDKVNKIMNDGQFIPRITAYFDSLMIFKSDLHLSGDLLDYKKNFKSIMNNLYTMPVPLLVENPQLSDFITLVSYFVVNEEKCTQLIEWKSRRDGAQCLAIMLNTRYKKQTARDYICSVYTGALNQQKTKVNLATIYGAVKGFCLLGSDAINRFLFPKIREIGHILKAQDPVREVTEIRKDLSSYLAKEIFKSAYDPDVGIDMSNLIARFGSYFTTFIYACMMNAPQFKGNLGPNTLFTINPVMFGDLVHFKCDIQSTKFVPYVYLKKNDLEEMLADPKSWVCVPCNNPLEGPKFLIKERNKPNNQILEKATIDLSKWIWKEYSPKIDPLNITIPEDAFVLIDITNQQTCDSTKRNITHIIDYLSLSQSSHLNLPFKLRNVILNDYRATLKDMNIEIKKVFPLAEFCETTLKKVQWRPEGEKGLPKMPLAPDHSQSLTFSGVLFMKIGSDIKYPNEKRIFWNNVEDISKLGSFMTMYSNSLTFEGVLRKLIEIVGDRETMPPELICID